MRYYRWFIQGYATIASPLTDCFKNEGFSWTALYQQVFDELKHLLSSTLVVALPNLSEEFNIETNDSGLGIGVVLSQGGNPISFYNKKLCRECIGLLHITGKCMLSRN